MQAMSRRAFAEQLALAVAAPYLIAFDEGRLVMLGRLYQSRTDWHRRQPTLT